MVIKSCSFEVFGDVQGASFRMHTIEAANKFHIVGFIKNTPKGTVAGIVQGTEPDFSAFKRWLSKEGSPYLHIDKCEFDNEKKMDNLTFKSFTVSH